MFGVLAEIEQFGLALRTSTLARLVAAFLDTDVVTTESKGAGVFVDQIVGATGAVFDHAFVLGANDHLLPGRVADDLVLTRLHGAEPLGVLTGPANRPLRDERGVLAALDGAAESVTVTWARWDVRSGGDLYPSPLLAAQPAVHEHVASHAAQLTSQHTAWLDADEWFTRHADRSTPRLARRRRAITVACAGGARRVRRTGGRARRRAPAHPPRRRRANRWRSASPRSRTGSPAASSTS